MTNGYFRETLYDALGQELRIDRLYYQQATGHQQLLIFHNARMGRVMTLDGVLQTAEADEFVYHEMMAHVPLFSHPEPRQVLIIGGGDGAMLREVLKHPLRQVTQVEIDPSVVEMARRYLPNHAAGAYEDPRLRLQFADGLDFVRQSDQLFDVIISDSTDPIGPGETLFRREFYRHVAARLAPDGIFVAQNGVPFLQMDELTGTHQRMAGLFAECRFFRAAVPSYYGGDMAFAWGSRTPGMADQPLSVLRRRFRESGIRTRYYRPEVHLASFALPGYWQDALEEDC